jgi:hypothetical protein
MFEHFKTLLKFDAYISPMTSVFRNHIYNMLNDILAYDEHLLGIKSKKE